MRKKAVRWFAFGLVICLLAWAGAAAADGLHTEVENPQLEMEVRLGYDGQVTYGKAIPVRVTVRNNGGDLEAMLAVNGYVNTAKYDRFETALSVPAGGERTVVLPVVAQTRQNTFTVEIVKDGKVICAVNSTPSGVINPNAMMIGVLSTRPRNLANLDINQENDVLYRYEFWQTVALTPETLPENPKLLDSFGMIVLDDTDPALLTEKQQQALKDWIVSGHVLIAGGGSTAPRNLAFLGDLTKLQASDFTVSDGVLSEVESLAGQKHSGRKTEIALAKLEGANPLISDSEGNGLVWLEGAGSGRIITLAWEAGDAALNAESAMHIFFQQLLIKMDPNMYSKLLYPGEESSALYSAGDDTKIQVRNSLPAAVAVIAGAVVICGVMWIILKKRSKTQWMWAVIPVAALAAAAVVTVMAGSSMLNRPVTATTVNLVQNAEGRATRYVFVTAAAPRPGLHRYSMNGEDLEAQVYDDGYYYWAEEEDTAELKEPSQLRVVQITGENGSSALNANTPWEVVRLSSVRTSEQEGQVEAQIWMESDGLHGTVRNGLPYSLKEGVVLSVYGFVRVPALAPRESREFAMVAKDAPDPSNPVFEDGVMLRNVTSGVYMVLSGMRENSDTNDYGGRESILSGMMNSAYDQLTRDNSAGTRENVIFVYCAEPEGDFASPLMVDGKEVEGGTVLPMYTAKIEYLKIGKTGVVFHAPGMDHAVRCEIDSSGMPAGDMAEDPNGGKLYYNYFPLSEHPTFRFTLENLDRIEIEKLSVGVEDWYANDVACFVLNVELKTWVEVQMNTPLKQPGKYLDEQGNLYCQFRPKVSDSYMDIPEPSLTLEGKIKEGGETHAEP